MGMEGEEIDRLCSMVNDQVGAAIRQWIDETMARTGLSKCELAMIAGKALIVEGGVLLGLACGEPNFDIGLGPARACLGEYKLMALKNKGGD